MKSSYRLPSAKPPLPPVVPRLVYERGDPEAATPGMAPAQSPNIRSILMVLRESYNSFDGLVLFPGNRPLNKQEPSMGLVIKELPVANFVDLPGSLTLSNDSE